jgi:hypothetical protein
MASEGSVAGSGEQAARHSQALGTEDRPRTEIGRASKDAAGVPLVLRIEEVCDRYEAAWRAVASTGDRPRLEDYLADISEPQQSAVLLELIALDVDYRRRAGEQPRAEEYAKRLPVLDSVQLASTLAGWTRIRASGVRERFASTILVRVRS